MNNIKFPKGNHSPFILAQAIKAHPGKAEQVLGCWREHWRTAGGQRDRFRDIIIGLPCIGFDGKRDGSYTTTAYRAWADEQQRAMTVGRRITPYEPLPEFVNLPDKRQELAHELALERAIDAWLERQGVTLAPSVAPGIAALKPLHSGSYEELPPTPGMPWGSRVFRRGDGRPSLIISSTSTDALDEQLVENGLCRSVLGGYIPFIVTLPEAMPDGAVRVGGAERVVEQPPAIYPPETMWDDGVSSIQRGMVAQEATTDEYLHQVIAGENHVGCDSVVSKDEEDYAKGQLELATSARHPYGMGPLANKPLAPFKSTPLWSPAKLRTHLTSEAYLRSVVAGESHYDLLGRKLVTVIGPEQVAHAESQLTMPAQGYRNPWPGQGL